MLTAHRCDPFKTWQLIYTYDPLEHTTPATPEQQQPMSLVDVSSLVVGGEVALWTEQTDTANLDTKLWPRTAAAAEVLWSGRRDAAGRERTTQAALPRLSALRRRLLAMGVQAEPVQMLWCELHPGQCEQPLALSN